MNNVDQRFEKEELRRRLANTGADHDAVVAPRLDHLGDRILSFAGARDQARIDVMAEVPHAFDLLVNESTDQLQGKIRMRGEVSDAGLEPNRKN
jgi:hypothetical protein